MVRIRLAYVTSDIDARGNVRYYFRRPKQPKIRLRGKPHSDEFTAAYSAALAGEAFTKATIAAPTSGTLHWLCSRYFASTKFTRMDHKTKSIRRNILEAICRQPASEVNATPIGTLAFATMPPQIVRTLRDRKAATPEAANNWLKSMKALFAWACLPEIALAHVNPAKDIPKFQSATQGFHPWSIEEVHQFEAEHPIGSMARLALTLLLYTGARRSDVVLFGRQHIKDGRLRFTQQKNIGSKPHKLVIPVLPHLQAVIDASDCKHMTFLINAWGRPFTPGGFTHRFRGWADQAGLPQCTPHGLRKAGATMAAMNGATPHQLMAIFGWRDIKQAENYTRSADQQRMADEGMHLLMRK